MLATFSCQLSAGAHSPPVQQSTDGRGQSGVWSTGIAYGIAMAVTRASNYDNVSLRIVCGTDGSEKLFLTTRVEGQDSVAANKLTGLKLPIRLDFDDGYSVEVISTAIWDGRQGAALGHQFVTITTPLLQAIKRNRSLEIQNMNERYRFSLLGADSAIRQLKCIP